MGTVYPSKASGSQSSALLTCVCVCEALVCFDDHCFWVLFGFWHELENLHLCSLLLRFNFIFLFMSCLFVFCLFKSSIMCITAKWGDCTGHWFGNLEFCLHYTFCKRLWNFYNKVVLFRGLFTDSKTTTSFASKSFWNKRNPWQWNAVISGAGCADRSTHHCANQRLEQRKHVLQLKLAE